MRAFIIILIAVLAALFAAGSIRAGGDSLLGHIDSALGITGFTDLYYTVFFFMHRGIKSVESEYNRTDRRLRDFQNKPLGFDKKKTYRRLDDAAHY
jgi:hypothetical protein